MEILNDLGQLRRRLGDDLYKKVAEEHLPQIRDCKINEVLDQANNLAIRRRADDMIEIDFNGEKVYVFLNN